MGVLASGRRQRRRAKSDVDTSALARDLPPLVEARYGPDVEVEVDVERMEVTTRRRAHLISVPLRGNPRSTRLLVKVPRGDGDATIDRGKERSLHRRAVALERAFAGTDQAVVGVVGYLPSLDATVVEHLEAEPLRQLLVRASDRSGSPSVAIEEVYQRLGRWLGRYYAEVGQARVLSVTLDQLMVFADYELDRLVELTDAIDLDRIRPQIHDLLTSVASTEILFAHPHGDLHAGNVLITADGRPTVIDSNAGDERWAPVVFDLAKLLVDPVLTRRQWMWRNRGLDDQTLGRWNHELVSNMLAPELHDPGLVELGCLIAVLHKWRFVLQESMTAPGGSRLRRPIEAWLRLAFEPLCLDRERLGRLVGRLH